MSASDAWHPGLLSQIPKELRPLSTIFRPENVSSSVRGVEELHALTGLRFAELVVFRPERLALHELLIRITADLVVPDGPRVEDLGINFRRIAARLLAAHIEPRAALIGEVFADARRRVVAATEAALTASVPALRRFGPAEIAQCERRAGEPGDAPVRLAHQMLARVLAALFAAHGEPWGTRELIVSLAAGMACNEYAGDAIGAVVGSVLARAAVEEGLGVLPPQERPVVINTKGPSAAGKSTLRPLQKKLAADIGVDWRDFALISPDIWRKQLLDYGTLGDAYKYAGAFTADELQIVDQKLDRYMARKYVNGGMTHLLIDRFRFDSFAPDSDRAGSNFLTRFGESAYLFFLITPPEQLVERAWKRGLEVGRYKAVDDTLAHAVEAYTGMPNVFFTWIRRSDKRIRFEFLDNTVALGERPRTVAFGDNDTINILDVRRMLDIERYGRIAIDATSPATLYRDPALLRAQRCTSFLRRCVQGFRHVRFAEQSSGLVYLALESGRPEYAARAGLERAAADPDARAGIEAVAPQALEGEIGGGREIGGRAAETLSRDLPTLGAWGQGAR